MKKMRVSSFGRKGTVIGSCTFGGKTLLYVVWDNNPRKEESVFSSEVRFEK